MAVDSFIQRKKDVLAKVDKSSIGGWDEKIQKLCEKINSSNNYYTTSSCAGRIIVMRDEKKKGPGLFVFVSHDLVWFDQLLESLTNKISQKQSRNLKFKSEPPIIHVACRTLEDAETLLDKGREIGWKKSGILSLGKRIIVELNGTDKLEFPLTKNGELLVEEKFLKVVLHDANEGLKRGWSLIEKLREVL